MPLPLPELFPDEDYRFHLTLRKGDLTEFFSRPDLAVLAERKWWLATEPQHYLGFLPEAEPLVDELASLAPQWVGAGVKPGSARERLLQLGEALEPDFMLMREDTPGHFQLQAGVVCFPSSWAPAEKFGLGLESIHGVVPRLNATLGASIGQFLQKLRPGLAFERANWGLAATAELNMHPHRENPRLALPIDLQKMWVRIEDQILAALPVTRGVIFGIKLRVIPVEVLLRDAVVAKGFERALRTMPDDVASYKGMLAIREPLLRAIQTSR
ncbi:heme-dependent oxidative N-demethylase subunit alpha family protein [Oleiharenicola lentus]|uniref:heme-dependent oxidative N-demethylase subunit alpha family protein n=1 Tax=Oleiharenicola lentus TaxID=2508720 RepID=UPI003F680091